MEHAHGRDGFQITRWRSCVENTVANRVELRTKLRREKNIEHYELRGSIELRTLGLICVWTYFVYVVPVICFLY